MNLRFGGGFEHWVVEVTRRLKNYGVHTTLICTDSTVGEKGRISSERIGFLTENVFEGYWELPHTRLSSVFSNLITPNANSLKKMMKKTDYDLMYFTNAYALQDIFVAAMKMFHKKPVISGHHAVIFQESFSHDLYITKISRPLLRKFDAYHVLNLNDQRILESWGLDSVNLIPIGVDTKRFSAETPKKKHEKLRVLFVGRLVPQKGIENLCRAIDIVNRSDVGKNIDFIIVGAGSLELMIRAVAENYSNVNFMGCIVDDELPELYRSCDLLVMPSKRETFGIVALEAQASGLPVIASNISGPRDILVDGISGTLISDEPSALARAIKKYHDIWSHDFEEYQRMCLSSRDNAMRRFDWNLIVKDFYQMLTRTYRSVYNK